MIVETKLSHQRWGPKKVLDYLRREQPEMDWPVDSTAGEILKRAGLVQPRLRRHRVAPYTQPFGECGGPNQSWSADFKGDFRLGKRTASLSADPQRQLLLIALLCRGLSGRAMRRLDLGLSGSFRQMGCLRPSLTHNGAPFASLAMGGMKPALEMVDKAWDQTRGADSSGQTRTERSPRANAPNVEGSSASAKNSSRTAAPLRSL